MDWNREGLNWPNREYSRTVMSGGSQWHVQQMGPLEAGAKTSRSILLLHGSGATTHSYAELMPLLAQSHQVTALDLPGHGFSQQLSGGQPSLPRVAAAIARLLNEEEILPDLVVGHSAGAAIAVQMVNEKLCSPAGLVAINGAFFPFGGLAGHLFPAAAKLLFLNPFVPKFFSFTAGHFGRVETLIDSTGSILSPKAMGYYRSVIGSAHHVEGTLALMANWDLSSMENQLRKLELPMLQIVGSRDGTIDPASAKRVAGLLKRGRLEVVQDKGHLVHEEVPEVVCRLILSFLEEISTQPAAG